MPCCLPARVSQRIVLRSIIPAGPLIEFRVIPTGYTQADIGRKMKARLEDQEREVTDWFVKHETLAIQLVKINPNLTIVRPDGSAMCIYPTIFPEPNFREKLERYVVEKDRSGSVFSPRSPTELELRSPVLRETVTKANEILDAFAKQHPGIVEYYMSPK